MKKLLFIIPKVKLKLKSFKILIFVFLTFFISQHIIAQVYGCHIYTLTGTQQRVYYVRDAARDFPNNSGWIATAPSYNTFDPVTECIVDATSGCTVYKSGTTGTSAADIMYSGGVEGTLYSYPCPIDDYIPLLFIFTIGITLIKFKKVVPL